MNDSSVPIFLEGAGSKLISSYASPFGRWPFICVFGFAIPLRETYFTCMVPHHLWTASKNHVRQHPLHKEESWPKMNAHSSLSYFRRKLFSIFQWNITSICFGCFFQGWRTHFPFVVGGFSVLLPECRSWLLLCWLISQALVGHCFQGTHYSKTVSRRFPIVPLGW